MQCIALGVVQQIFPPTRFSDSTVSESFDLLGFQGVGLVIWNSSGTVHEPNGSLVLSLEHSEDEATWEAVPGDDPGGILGYDCGNIEVRRLPSGNLHRYLRATLTVEGLGQDFFSSIEFIGIRKAT